MKKAVLFLTFNRLDVVQKVFEQIKIAQPPRLYLASDGPRDTKAGERELVEEVRNWMISNIDWNCEVKTLFREQNLGCGHAVSQAITWFFENEPDGIILEDDCLANQSFFKFCEEMLDYYKDNKQIFHISGTQFHNNFQGAESYYFSKDIVAWGWATWADRWNFYEFDLTNYDENIIKNFDASKKVKKFLLRTLKDMQEHKIDTWDYQWLFMFLKYNGIGILPKLNLVTNIGFYGHHYSKAEADPLLNRPRYEIDKIVHQKNIDKVFKITANLKPITLMDILGYIKTYPLFFLRKKFWQEII